MNIRFAQRNIYKKRIFLACLVFIGCRLNPFSSFDLYLRRKSSPVFGLYITIFLSRDTMQARYMLWSCICPSVCLSHAKHIIAQQCRYSIGEIQLG